MGLPAAPRKRLKEEEGNAKAATAKIAKETLMQWQ